MMRQGRKKICFIMALGILAASLGGCMYYDNKNWETMTAKEKQEAQQVFAEERKELEEEFAGDGIKEAFASYILNTIERAME